MPAYWSVRMTVSKLIHKAFKAETNSTLVQLFRYGFVACVAFAVDFSSLWGFTELAGLHYLVSAALAFLLGVTTNYLIAVRWVFAQRAVKDRRVEAGIYFLIGLAGLALNELIMWSVTEHLHQHYLVSKLISTGLVFFFNFFLRKFLLFSRRG